LAVSGVSSVIIAGFYTSRFKSVILPIDDWTDIPTGGSVGTWLLQNAGFPDAFWKMTRTVNFGGNSPTSSLRISMSGSFTPGQSISIQGSYELLFASSLNMSIEAGPNWSQAGLPAGEKPAGVNEFNYNLNCITGYTGTIDILLKPTFAVNPPSTQVTFTIKEVTSPSFPSTFGPMTLEVWQYVASVWSIANSYSLPYSGEPDVFVREIASINPAATNVGARLVGNNLNAVNKFQITELRNSEAFYFRSNAWGINKVQTTISYALQTVGTFAVLAGQEIDISFTSYFDNPNAFITIDGVAGQFNIPGIGAYAWRGYIIATGNLQIVIKVTGIADIIVNDIKLNKVPIDLYAVGRTAGVNTDLYKITRSESSANIENLTVPLPNAIAYDNLGIRVDSRGTSGYFSIFYFQKL
jgi:hypothetical protein